MPTVEERGRRLLAPLSVPLLSGTSSVGAGDEREVGLACPDEDGGSYENIIIFLLESKRHCLPAMISEPWKDTVTEY